MYIKLTKNKNLQLLFAFVVLYVFFIPASHLVISSSYTHTHTYIMCACHLSTLRAKIGSEVQDNPQLPKYFQALLGYIT